MTRVMLGDCMGLFDYFIKHEIIRIPMSVMESKRVFSWLKYRRLQVPNMVKQMNNEKKWFSQ